LVIGHVIQTQLSCFMYRWDVPLVIRPSD
jgi:hypothetical protein